ncbi:MAG: TolC family protein [Acidobacteriota bacterium]|jgi:outer membrane protein
MFSTSVFRQEEKETAVPEIVGRVFSPHRHVAGPSRGKRRQLRGVRLFFMLLFSLVAVPPIPGEEAVLRLTLQEAVRLALQQNPQVQIAGINLAQSEKDKNIARSALLPEIKAEVSETVRRTNLEAFTGRTIPGFSKQVGPLDIFQGGGSFSLPVFDLTLWRRWQAAGDTVGGMELQAKSVKEQVILLVVSQYLGCLRENADVMAIKSRVGLAQALYQLAEDLQTNGAGTRIDALRANVTLQNEKQKLIVAETRSKTYLYTLAQLLNIDPQTTIELADAMEFFKVPDTEESEALKRAFETRPEMQDLNARIRAIERQKQASKAARLPSVYADGFWAYQGLSIGNSIPVYEYRVRLSLPLFTGGRTGAEIAKADLQKTELIQEKMELRNRIALEVKVARAALDSARSELDVANLGLKLAGEEIAQARDRFEAGVTNNIEVITAQDELARANDNQINALYRYNQARADMARAGGQMELLYSK